MQSTPTLGFMFMQHAGKWKCNRCPFEVPYNPSWSIMSDAITEHYETHHPAFEVGSKPLSDVQLRTSLYTYQVTVERAIAEGHDVAWLKAEVERLLAKVY